jgi:hypothetical protein
LVFERSDCSDPSTRNQSLTAANSIGIFESLRKLGSSLARCKYLPNLGNVRSAWDSDIRADGQPTTALKPYLPLALTVRGPQIREPGVEMWHETCADNLLRATWLAPQPLTITIQAVRAHWSHESCQNQNLIRDFPALRATPSFCRFRDTRRSRHLKGIWSATTGIPGRSRTLQQPKPWNKRVR